MAKHPYSSLPPEAFWKSAVAEFHIQNLSDLWPGIRLSKSDRIATAGSCFAQYIGRELQTRGFNFIDLEPPPAALDRSTALRHGFLTYSCRYGNIYSARQLHQLALEALGHRSPDEVIWETQRRFFDALRVSVDPAGHDSREIVEQLRRAHLLRVRELLQTVDVFIFTLGLTEAWEAVSDGTVYPTAPGTTAGEFDPVRYRFRNFRYPDVRDDLLGFWRLLRSVNSSARMVLTVSPVPLTATASGQHVLVATTQSKSTLRAVAGDIAADVEGISYFPAYEIIASHPSRAMFFEPNLRNVNKAGVSYVMHHFFAEPKDQGEPPMVPTAESVNEHFPNDIVCDEEKLEQFAR